VSQANFSIGPLDGPYRSEREPRLGPLQDAIHEIG
jgi:hypothetical protein